MKEFYFLFHEILSKTENKEAFIICFDLIISRKGSKIFDRTIPSKNSFKKMITNRLFVVKNFGISYHAVIVGGFAAVQSIGQWQKII